MIKKFIDKLLGKSAGKTPSGPQTLAAEPEAAVPVGPVIGVRVEVPVSEHGINPALLDDRAVKVVTTLQDAGYEA